MALKGRLRQIGAMPKLRIVDGGWDGFPNRRSSAGGLAASGNVIPFRARKPLPVGGFAMTVGVTATVSTRRGVVSLMLRDDVDLELTPVQARALAVDLFEIANITTGRS
jgi:hypothetical protein